MSEPATGPIRIRFNLDNEFAIAAAFMPGGIGLLIDPEHWQPIYLLAIGMLLYTAIISPGYFLNLI